MRKKLGNVTYEVEFKGKEPSNRHIDHLTERKIDTVEEFQETIPSEGYEDILGTGIEASKEKPSISSDLGIRETTMPEDISLNPIRSTPSNPMMNSSSTTLRRSTRVGKKPSWCKDFVSK